MTNRKHPPKRDSTPEEIRRECERIQAEWSRREEWKHRVTKISGPVEFETVKTPKVDG